MGPRSLGPATAADQESLPREMLCFPIYDLLQQTQPSRRADEMTDNLGICCHLIAIFLFCFLMRGHSQAEQLTANMSHALRVVSLVYASVSHVVCRDDKYMKLE